MGEFVRLETGEAEGVATIRLDRPKMNAISQDLTQELGEVIDEVAGRSDIGAVVIWGGPRVFAAGADIKEFPSLDVEGARNLSNNLNGVLLRLEALPQVTIAAVNGYALGGGMELSMAAEFRLMADDATFGQPEILLGIIPGGGGTQRLPALVGVTKAKELIYTGRQVKAEEALDIGLVSAVHPADQLYAEALALAATYAAGPYAIRLAKAAIMEGLVLPMSEGTAVEAERFAACFDTDDTKAGVQSFIENGPGKATFTQS